MKRIKNKIILITGASSGIGETTAKLLAKHGAHVVLTARSEDNLQRVKIEIEKSGGKANHYPIDLTNHKSVEVVAQKIISQVGVPDVIINNAGAGNWLSIFETSNEEFSQMQSAPHFAAFFVTKTFIHYMVKRGSGHIINLNSASCYFSYPGAMGYLSSRWALRSFSNALQNEMYGTGVKVSMVVAGKVDSPYFSNNPISEDRIPKIAMYLTRTLSMNEVARTIALTIGSKRKTIIIPFSMNVLVYLNRFFPVFFSFLQRRTGHSIDKNSITT